MITFFRIDDEKKSTNLSHSHFVTVKVRIKDLRSLTLSTELNQIRELITCIQSIISIGNRRLAMNIKIKGTTPT